MLLIFLWLLALDILFIASVIRIEYCPIALFSECHAPLIVIQRHGSPLKDHRYRINLSHITLGMYDGNAEDYSCKYRGLLANALVDKAR